MKNRTSKILMVGAMCLSLSVMLASEAHKEKKFSATMQDEMGLSTKDLSVVPSIDFTIHNYGYDMVGHLNLQIILLKENGHRWDILVQNKALPLAKKIWLLNCQIAQK